MISLSVSAIWEEPLISLEILPFAIFSISAAVFAIGFRIILWKRVVVRNRKDVAVMRVVDGREVMDVDVADGRR